MRAPRPTRRQLKALDRIYAALPTLECRGQCQECCGPIFMSGAEWGRIIDRLGHAPRGDASLVCPMLDRDSGRCTIYDIRPAICRLWGLVPSMACPFGCRPSRWLTEREGHAILAEIERATQPVRAKRR